VCGKMLLIDEKKIHERGRDLRSTKAADSSLTEKNTAESAIVTRIS